MGRNHPCLDGGVHCTPPLGVSGFVALAALLLLAIATNLLSQPGAALAAATAIIVLGLPHGAYDIQLLANPAHWASSNGRQTWVDGRLLVAYLLLLALAVAIWAIAPAVALLIFLVMAAVHFGEDWDMLDPGLLRHISGLSIITAVAFASPADVARLFGLLSSPSFGTILMQALVMAAPMVLLVTGVAMLIAVQRGHGRWALAHALALAIALVTPPVVGFAAYFVIIHSAIHLKAARYALADYPFAVFALQGLVVSGLCLAVMLAVDPRASLPADSRLPLLVFQLLAVLTVPHLLLTHGWLPGFDHLSPDQNKKAGRLSHPAPLVR
jgi:beta-carotene 15,15'-dioxygenase